MAKYFPQELGLRRKFNDETVLKRFLNYILTNIMMTIGDDEYDESDESDELDESNISNITYTAVDSNTKWKLELLFKDLNFPF